MTVWRCLRLALLPLVAACGSPLEQEYGLIEVENGAEASVAAWGYAYCGTSEILPVEIATADGQLPQGSFATVAERAGSCTNHTFELATGRTIVEANVVVPAAYTTVRILLRPPPAATSVP